MWVPTTDIQACIFASGMCLPILPGNTTCLCLWDSGQKAKHDGTQSVRWQLSVPCMLHMPWVQIPIKPTQLSGVVVDRGPGKMAVCLSSAEPGKQLCIIWQSKQTQVQPAQAAPVHHTPCLACNIHSGHWLNLTQWPLLMYHLLPFCRLHVRPSQVSRPQGTPV
jgi:hypothetical protein